MTMLPHNRVQWVYSSTNDQELEDRYNEWAGEYDSDLDSEFGWLSPKTASEALAKHVPNDGAILDAGAGTGLVGEVLSGLGYKNLVAMDLSLGMLDEARKKGIYREYHKMTLGEHLDFPDNKFDAVISVGVFTVGHAPISSFDELVRITKSGGYIVFSIRPDTYETEGFKEKQSALENEGKWTLSDVSDKYQPLPKGEPEVLHQVWVYQVT